MKKKEAILEDITHSNENVNTEEKIIHKYEKESSKKKKKRNLKNHFKTTQNERDKFSSFNQF